MTLQDEKYRLWKYGIDTVTCFAETYKNKRSIYFSVSNLLPSALLMTEAGREYHLVLMGSQDGELLHKDFGAIFINQKGEGGIFRKFTGAEIQCYTHCLFLTLDRDGGSTETVYSGEMPFYKETTTAVDKSPFEETWADYFSCCNQSAQVHAFTMGRDEIGADWFRMEKTEKLPAYLRDCAEQVRKYGHLLLGKKNEDFFVGVPGRFLLEEQPYKKEGFFTLWQPVRGGESFFGQLSELTGSVAEEIFGYWIAGIDVETGELKPL